jgi:hypothetical protein
MITDKDVEKLKETFATKEEILPMKQDIIELKSDVKILKNDVSTLKEDMSTVKETTQNILTIVDKMAKNWDQAEIVALKKSDELQNRQLKQLADHNGLNLMD